MFPDPVLQLHTTRSWDFLEAADSKFRARYPHKHRSVDVIIGIIDTGSYIFYISSSFKRLQIHVCFMNRVVSGVWPESPSFNDHRVGKIPSKWKGVCMEGLDFNKTHCNRYAS